MPLPGEVAGARSSAALQRGETSYTGQCLRRRMGFFVIGVAIVVFAGLYAGYGLRQTPAVPPPSWMWWLVGLAFLCFGGALATWA